MTPIEIIGVPLDLGTGRRGVDMGPSAMRIAELRDQVAALGYAVTDRGNLTTPIRETMSAGDPQKKYIQEIAGVCQRVCDAVVASLERQTIPVVIGGDHSLAAGSVAATAAVAHRRDARVGLIWIDAHGDMNTPATTTSGSVHGMPLAALLGPEPAELAGLGGITPVVEPRHTVLVGVRNLDAAERERVRAADIHVFSMKDIDRLGMATVADQALARASDGTSGVHVSFDLDVCDPAIAPGVGTPVRGGLSYREAHLLMETIAERGMLQTLDVVELNPTLDTHNQTAELAVELVLSALGLRII